MECSLESCMLFGILLMRLNAQPNHLKNNESKLRQKEKLFCRIIKAVTYASTFV